MAPTNSRKVRRVKCGEERPVCLRCSSTGRKCEGYERQTYLYVPGGREEEGGFRSTSSQWQLALAPTPFKGRELRSLRFFEERTAAQLNGLFPEDFWGELVPQVAHAESSIRHALIALSGFHESFLVAGSGEGGEANRFGFQQYNLAIRELVHPQMKEGSPLVALLCCLLFISIEVRNLDGPEGASGSVVANDDCSSCKAGFSRQSSYS